MPAGYRHERPYPGQGFTLQNAADANFLVICRCMLCKRPAVRYLAEDLLAFRDPKGYADEPPFPCSKCGTREYVRVTFHQPSLGDYGHLEVRRPAGIRKTQMWKTVRLGD